MTTYTKKSLKAYLKSKPEETATDVLCDIIVDLYFKIKEGVKEGKHVEGYIRELHILLDDLLVTPKSQSTSNQKVKSDLDDKLKKELERVMGE